jgi:hypothetical protein
MFSIVFVFQRPDVQTRQCPHTVAVVTNLWFDVCG